MKKQVEEFNNIMVDIETLSTKSYAVIVSIAAVQFNLETGEVGFVFRKNISIQSCLDIGLKVDGATIQWWLNQSILAKTNSFQGQENIKEVLVSLDEFYLQKFENLPEIWGNSASFDLGLLANAYEKCKLPIPWKYTKENDVRTYLKSVKNKPIPFEGVKHNPVHDCYHQIKQCHEAYKAINNK